MLKLDAVISRRRRLVLGTWVALLAVALPFAMHQSDHLTGGGFNVPGSQDEIVQAAQAENFGGARTDLGVVLVERNSDHAAQLDAAIGRAATVVQHTAGVTIPASSQAAARALARRSRTVVLDVPLRVASDSSIDVAAKLRKALTVGAAHAGVTAHLIGQGALWAGMQDLSKSDLKTAESTGFPIVLLILLAVFGSFAAAALPLALGVVSVMVTGGEIYWLSQAMEMSVFVTNMASMIGIGVAVDYSLFVLARYREEIATGKGVDAARATALVTSGVAVIFSGMTVIVALAGLWMVDNAAIRSMAGGAMLVVAVSVLASATLLPALISLLGTRAAGGTQAWVTFRRRPAAAPEGDGFWLRWTRVVTKRPAITATAAAAVLLALAIPTLSLKMGSGALQQFPKGNEVRVGFEAASSVIGQGASSPIEVLLSAPAGSPLTAATVHAVRTVIAGDPSVAGIASAVRSRDARQVLIEAVPNVDGESAAAKALVARLRRELPAAARGRASIVAGGTTAAQKDFNALVSGSMWKILLFVLGLSYLVLLVLLRSVVLPLKAVAMNLLSVGAAYGVLVAVFQWGWGASLLGVQAPGHLDTLTPPLVLAVVFGLSMDYEVFLLTRIRERWQATGDSRLAVAQGLASSARTITSAALIMTCVFLVFVGTSVPSIEELGLGNAVAILVDATLVRLVLVPATMELLGDWNWWLPKPLARALPKQSFEAAPAGV
jgi:RND superfamily putative drug exporter